MSKNMGYGICGAKNRYSNKALLDNWVEDQFGEEIVAKGDRPGSTMYQTASMASYCDPKDMKVHPNILKVKLESVANLKTRNKEGMPYSLLFTNENSLIGQGPQFMSTMQRIQGNGAGATFALRDGSRTDEMSKSVKREKTGIRQPQSTYNEANRRLDKVPDVVRMADGPIEELPVFKRRALISGWSK